MAEKKLIRNFSIIAHIDHGKSTIADCLIQFCGGLSERDMQAQVLDSMDIERERGITIKSQTVRLNYLAKDGNTYQLNLMDTPGHVDFSYEVSRSLAACEGALLVVDSAQGVEAQTLANVYKAFENDLTLIPVLNKIDLPSADPEAVKQQIEEVIGIETENSIEASAKKMIGIEDILEAIVTQIPPPQYEEEQADTLKALLVDGWYDNYLGVILLVRIINGSVQKGDKIKLIASNSQYLVDSVGIFTPKKIETSSLCEGEIGFINATIKDLQDCKIGDTITYSNSEVEVLPGFKPSKSVVFCSIFPIDQGEFEKLKVSLAKLKLNDASIEYSIETSGALGLGFRCGFLGLLHLEIIQERLEREFDLEIITTAPSVIYELILNNGETKLIHNPSDMPDPVFIKKILEPWINATIFVPEAYLGAILSLCTDRRGVQKEMKYINDRVMLSYELPLNEVVFDFYDHLKSCSSGYASFDWELSKHIEEDLVKLTTLINGEAVDALSFVLHRSRAESRGRRLCEKLKDLIPKQMFKIAIQAALGGKIIARETISAMRKDVTAKCYGGDVTRKRKLLDKQKKGKAKMREIGNVQVPKSAFINALKLDKS